MNCFCFIFEWIVDFICTIMCCPYIYVLCHSCEDQSKPKRSESQQHLLVSEETKIESCSSCKCSSSKKFSHECCCCTYEICKLRCCYYNVFRNDGNKKTGKPKNNELLKEIIEFLKELLKRLEKFDKETLEIIENSLESIKSKLNDYIKLLEQIKNLKIELQKNEEENIIILIKQKKLIETMNETTITIQDSMKSSRGMMEPYLNKIVDFEKKLTEYLKEKEKIEKQIRMNQEENKSLNEKINKFELKRENILNSIAVHFSFITNECFHCVEKYNEQNILIENETNKEINKINEDLIVIDLEKEKQRMDMETIIENMKQEFQQYSQNQNEKIGNNEKKLREETRKVKALKKEINQEKLMCVEKEVNDYLVKNNIYYVDYEVNIHLKKENIRINKEYFEKNKQNKIQLPIVKERYIIKDKQRIQSSIKVEMEEFDFSKYKIKDGTIENIEGSEIMYVEKEEGEEENITEKEKMRRSISLIKVPTKNSKRIEELKGNSLETSQQMKLNEERMKELEKELDENKKRIEKLENEKQQLEEERNQMKKFIEQKTQQENKQLQNIQNQQLQPECTDIAIPLIYYIDINKKFIYTTANGQQAQLNINGDVKDGQIIQIKQGGTPINGIPRDLYLRIFGNYQPFSRDGYNLIFKLQCSRKMEGEHHTYPIPFPNGEKREFEFDVKDGVIAQFEGQGLMASNGQRGNLIFSICYND